MRREDRYLRRLSTRGRDTTRQRREVDMYTYDQPIFRKDVGFALTNEGYDAYKKDTEEWNKNYSTAMAEYEKSNSALAKREKELNKAKGSLSSAYKNLKGATLDAAWKNYTKSFMPINVIGQNQKVEGTYYLPKEAISEIDKSVFNKGNGSYVGRFKGNVYNVSVTPQGTSSAYGKELHQSLSQASNQVKSDFYQQNKDSFLKEKKRAESALAGQSDILSTGYSNLQQERDLLEGQLEEVNAAKARREEELNNMKTSYDTKISNMRKLFQSR